MKRGKKDHPVVRWFLYIVWIFLFFVAIYDLFNVPYRSLIWFGCLFLLVFFYFRLKRIPSFVFLLVSLAFVLSVFGELFFEFYYIFDCTDSFCVALIYDKILHLVHSAIACTFIYFLAKPRIKNKKMLILFAITATITLSVFWELFEFLLDNLFGAYTQGVYSFEGSDAFRIDIEVGEEVLSKLSDTMFDFISNTIGCIIFWIVNAFYYNRKNL